MSMEISSRPGLGPIRTHVLVYIFEILTRRSYGLVLVFKVLRFYEYITNTSEYFFNEIVKII